MSKEAIGIMGGSFNPIHIGHLVVAEEARVKYNLKKVIFIPVGIPGYKKRTKLIDPERRFVMTLLATVSNPYFFVSRIEIDRKGKCYTYDTIKELREIYPEENYDLYFITGADAVLSILTWKNPRELLQMCYFIAATRPGYSLKRLKEKLGKIGECCIDKVFPLQVPALSISSTLIRERIRKGYTIKYLVPKEVEDYIYKNNLYKEEDPWEPKEKNRVLKLIYDAIKEKKGDEILCLDTRKLTYLFDYLFICSADTDIQAKAIMDNIYMKMKKELKRLPIKIDGSDEGTWIIMDYGDVMVHIFNPIKRIYYNLESIWVDAKAIDLES